MSRKHSIGQELIEAMQEAVAYVQSDPGKTTTRKVVVRKRFFIEMRLRPGKAPGPHADWIRDWQRMPKAYATAGRRDQALASLQAKDTLFEYRAETAA